MTKYHADFVVTSWPLANTMTHKMRCYGPKTIEPWVKKDIPRSGACATDTPHTGLHTTTKQICEITSKWQVEHCKAWKW